MTEIIAEIEFLKALQSRLETVPSATDECIDAVCAIIADVVFRRMTLERELATFERSQRDCVMDADDLPRWDLVTADYYTYREAM